VDTSAEIVAILNTTPTTFLESPSSAPDADYEYANKKYVDDNISSGSGSVTTVQEGDVGVGGADIVTLDFTANDFAVSEDPDTEANISIDYTNGQKATNAQPGFATAAQITALEAIDTEAELEALLELQDLQGAVTDTQVPNDITITEADPNVDTSSEIATILNTSPSTQIDEEVIQQAWENCLSSAPGSPVVGRMYCADGDNWQIESRQGTDDWAVLYMNSDYIAVYNITDGTRLHGEECFSPIIYSTPDIMQAEQDAWPVIHFPVEKFPDGFEVTSIQISTSATCTDTLNFEEWSNNGTAWITISTIESITLSGTFTEDDGTLSDSTIAADSWLYVDLDDSATDISYMTVTVCGY
jgi:hypothetical protein